MGWIIFGIILVLVVFVIAWVIGTYNKLVTQRNKVKNSWSQIDTQLTRRFDLIPNLVETVKGYTKHEKDIFEQFAQARNIFAQANQTNNVADISKADGMLSSAISRLIALNEAYPELKADKNYTEMMSQLKDTEDKIAYTRQFYNDVVTTYNTTREKFPASIIANMFSFKEAEVFKADEETRKNVKVQF